jgi:hypothetical protein
MTSPFFQFPVASPERRVAFAMRQNHPLSGLIAFDAVTSRHCDTAKTNTKTINALRTRHVNS